MGRNCRRISLLFLEKIMSKFNGIAKAGSISNPADPITIPNAQAGTWTHNNGQRAVLVQFVNANAVSNVDPLVVITQTNANVIVVTNGAAAPIAGVIRATFEDGAIGEASVAPASDVVVA
jgi:hypothetical protein